MKKIIVSIFALAFLLGAASVSAKIDKGPKAEDVKLHKKQVLTDDERKAIDEISKGKPGDKKPTARIPDSWATGIAVPLPSGGERYAIVVGLANYSGITNDLCVTAAKINDADANVYPTTDIKHYCQDYDSLNMQQALEGYGFNNPANIILLRDSGATRTSVLNAMQTLKGKVKANDEVVFFFSGHGTSGKLISLKDSETIDEAIYLYDSSVIWDDELKIWADSMPAYREVFAFDSCLAGGMNDIARNNRVIAMSSGETQSSWTYTVGGALLTDGSYAYSEGLFAHSFVENGMNNKYADASNLLSTPDGKVAVEESFGYTYPLVLFRQTPVLSDGYDNDLVLGL